MDRRKRKLIGAGLLVLGAATILITMPLAERSIQEQGRRALAEADMEARLNPHPGIGHGMSALPYPTTAYISNVLGGLLILAGALVLSSRFGRKKVGTAPASVVITSPSAVPAVPLDCVATRYCTNCGRETPSGAKFCMNCGTPVC